MDVLSKVFARAARRGSPAAGSEAVPAELGRDRSETIGAHGEKKEGDGLHCGWTCVVAGRVELEL